MSTLDQDYDQSKASSVEIDEQSLTIPADVGMERDPEEEIKNLERERRDLQDELTAIRRALPIFKDANNKDVTSQMLELASEMQRYKNETDELHENLERMRRELTEANSEVVRTRAECKNLVEDLEFRCSEYEKENADLKQYIESEDARRHDESNSSTFAASMLSTRDHEINELKTMAMKQGAQLMELKRLLDTSEEERQDAIAKLCETQKFLNESKNNLASLQQEVQTFESENQELREYIVNLEQELSKKDMDIKKRNETIKGFHKLLKQFQSRKTSESEIGSVAEFDSMITNQDENQEAVLCSHLLAVLRKLKSNWKDNANLFYEIKEFIKEHGAIEADELESLTESICRQDDERNSQAGDLNKTPEAISNQGSSASDAKARLSRSTSFRPTHEADIELLVDMADNNFTYAVNTGDLQLLSEQVAVLKKWCMNYFEKLKLLTILVQTLLEELQDTDEGHSILQRINELHLDLNKTMDQAGGIFVEFEKTERSIKEAIEQSINQTNVQNRGADSDRVEPNVSIASSVIELQNRSANLAKIDELRAENSRLVQRLDGIASENENLVVELNKFKREVQQLRDDLKKRYEESIEMKATLDEAMLHNHSVAEEFSRFRNEAAENIQQLEMKIKQLKDYITNFKETFAAIEINNTFIDIRDYPSSMTSEEHQTIWECLKRVYELQNANIEYDNELQKLKREYEVFYKKAMAEKNDLNSELSDQKHQFDLYRKEAEQKQKEWVEMMEKNNETLENRIKPSVNPEKVQALHKELKSISEILSEGQKEIISTFAKVPKSRNSKK